MEFSDPAECWSRVFSAKWFRKYICATIVLFPMWLLMCCSVNIYCEIQTALGFACNRKSRVRNSDSFATLQVDRHHQRHASSTERVWFFSVLTGSSGFISQGLVKGTQPSLFPCLPRPKTSVNGLFSGVLRGWHINQWASVCHMVATSNLPFFLSKLFSNIGCKLNRAPSDRKDRWTW